jgi:rubrerythrin
LKNEKNLNEKTRKQKSYICRQCCTFLDLTDLKDGNCPNCGTDENIYNNDLLEDQEEE